MLPSAICIYQKKNLTEKLGYIGKINHSANKPNSKSSKKFLNAKILE